MATGSSRSSRRSTTSTPNSTPTASSAARSGPTGRTASSVTTPTSTGPNLLPWVELAYYRQFGDLDRLHRVFPVLCAYAKWWRLNRTWPDGSYWSSGWGTGMDNMPRVKEEYNPIYSHGHMSWLDTNLQQYLVDASLLQIGFYIERWQEIEELEDEMKFLKGYLNERMWDDRRGFLCDRYADGTLCSTLGIGAYWALQTDVLDSVRLARLVSHLRDTAEFNRPHRVPSLAADHPKYNPNGRYWQGGVWPGTNYMLIDGLRQQGYGELAHEIAENHYRAVFEVWKKTGTFWEYYAPERIEPGFMARKDFVGWTGLPPIAVFIEYILGIRSDYSERSHRMGPHEDRGARYLALSLRARGGCQPARRAPEERHGAPRDPGRVRGALRPDGPLGRERVPHGPRGPERRSQTELKKQDQS